MTEADEYELVVTPPAARALSDQLPEAVAAAVIEFLAAALVREPRRVGKPLRGDLDRNLVSPPRDLSHSLPGPRGPPRGHRPPDRTPPRRVSTLTQRLAPWQSTRPAPATRTIEASPRSSIVRSGRSAAKAIAGSNGVSQRSAVAIACRSYDRHLMQDREFPMTGGCGCGAVRFEVTAPLGSGVYCHCMRCQRRTGTGASATALAQPGSFNIVSGEDRMHAWRPEGGWEKWFCADCGSAIYSRHPSEPQRIGVRLRRVWRQRPPALARACTNTLRAPPRGSRFQTTGSPGSKEPHTRTEQRPVSPTR